ncbi:MAG: hypothetical protein Greene041619_1034 [Candidatus Peregrinibacteria bacterium Greene0416_19]|nr:MAG: hypothetical protein Greene041619_1034 [Candidatus Peregrinibacteria bacterium Greene0416_19]
MSACGRRPVVIPLGVQTFTGTVERVPLDLNRRGTHMLNIGGEDVYYLESTAVSLRSVEGMEVELQGTVEANIRTADLPVLVVTSIITSLDEGFRAWRYAPLGITLDIPRNWIPGASGEVVQFTASGSKRVVLSLFLQPIDGLPFHASSALLPANERVTPDVVGSRRAILVEDTATRIERFHVDRGEGKAPEKQILTLQFAPSRS